MSRAGAEGKFLEKGEPPYTRRPPPQRAARACRAAPPLASVWACAAGKAAISIAASCRYPGCPRRRSPFGPRCWSPGPARSEEHTSELQSRLHLVCRLLLEKKKKTKRTNRSRLHTH